MNKHCLKNKHRGSLTVEATILVPFVLTSWLIIANFMNIFLLHIVIQQALNNTVREIAQYSYFITRYDAYDKLATFNYSEDTYKKGNEILDQVDSAVDNGKKVINNSKQYIEDVKQEGTNVASTAEAVNELLRDIGGASGDELVQDLKNISHTGEQTVGGIENLSIKNLKENIITPANNFKNAIKGAFDVIKTINGDNIKNHFIATTAQHGVGALSGILMEMYIRNLNMRVTDDVTGFTMQNSSFFIPDKVSGDDKMDIIVLEADYTCHNPFNLIFISDINFAQYAVIRTWLGDGKSITKYAN